MNWINMVTPISTAILAVLTFFYVRYTYKLLSETNRPEVVVFLKFSEFYPKSKNDNKYHCKLFFCIKNVGLRTARHIEFPKVDLSFQPADSGPLSEIKSLKNGIDILVPGQTVTHIVSVSLNAHSILNHNHYEDIGSEVKIKVEYKSTGKRNYKDNFTLDFLQWNGRQPKINSQ